jgi:hypothetical protein
MMVKKDIVSESGALACQVEQHGLVFRQHRARACHACYDVRTGMMCSAAGEISS